MIILFLIFSAAFFQVIAVLVGHNTQERFVSLINYILIKIFIRQAKLVRLEFCATLYTESWRVAITYISTILNLWRELSINFSPKIFLPLERML